MKHPVTTLANLQRIKSMKKALSCHHLDETCDRCWLIFISREGLALGSQDYRPGGVTMEERVNSHPSVL